MTNFSKTILYIGVCSVIVITNNLANTLSIKEAIEKRAYKKLTKENKELIEYIIFGENQE